MTAVEPFSNGEDETLRAAKLNILRDGKSNNTGVITLSAGEQTVLSDPRIGQDATIILQPSNASAAALGNLWITLQNETATLNHPAALGTETFQYVIMG